MIAVLFFKVSQAHLLLPRIAVMNGTIKCCTRNIYPYGPTSIPTKLYEEAEKVVQQAKSTKFYNLTQQYQFTLPPNLPTYNTFIEVVEGDCLDEAIRLKSLGLNPVILNMASAKRPGGGYRTGAGAQEENLFRRSNYYQSLEDPDGLDTGREWGYPLPEFCTIYSPSVFVFRSSEQTGT